MTEFATYPHLYSAESYGSACSNLPDCSQDPESRYYLTTAIAYTNGLPHIGHAYEFLTADIITRYNRILGKNVFFLTGTDEHGQKVAASAEKVGIAPIDHCNGYVEAFKSLHKQLLVSYSGFQRTTTPEHKLTCQKLWQKCFDNGDIYLDAYEGWYNEREEVFVSNTEAEASEFKDPGSGLPLKRVTEESYFFRMSKYADALLAHIESCPSFIQPELHRNNITLRIQKEGLKDLSISRTSFSWGIPVPSGFDSKHVMYVWFDALTNYLTGVRALDPEDPLSSYWPASTHIIGKDIAWFHCVIWPCMLMSAGLPLPASVFAHGFVNASDGRKMSKSYNNTIDPVEILQRFNVDSVRYYCAASITYGADINFSEDSLIQMHNSELADILGNLVNRAFNLCSKYCGGVVPDALHDSEFPLPFDLAALKEGVKEDMKACAINLALFKAIDAARATNGFLTKAEPWKMKGERELKRVAIVRTTLEAIYAFTHFLAPVIPLAAEQIFKNLHTNPISSFNLRDDFYNLTPGTEVTVGSILFQKIGDQQEAPGTEASSAPAPATVATAAKAKAAANKKAPIAQSIPTEEVQHSIDFTKMEIRVGEIVRVWNHETAERLFCEEINVGDAAGPRQIASGLRQFYTLEEMQGRKVLVVCNLKESKFQGFMSFGMVLAAKAADGSKVELVTPPKDSRVGEQVFLAGYEDFAKESAVWPSAKIKKNKIWESVAPGLGTDESGVAHWQGNQILTSAGPCKVDTLCNSVVG